jgi:predicted nucleic acid-binding protein
MTRYVIDASIVADYLVAGTFTPQVVTLFDQLAEATELWIPELCLIECANVLWKRVRFEGMPTETAERIVGEIGALPLMILAIEDLLPRALGIAVEQSLAVYDAIYIALAERLQAQLITGDKRQAIASEAVGVTLKSVIDFSPSAP